MISSLLHIISLRPRVSYTEPNLGGGVGKAHLQPLNTPMIRRKKVEERTPYEHFLGRGERLLLLPLRALMYTDKYL